MKSIFDTVSRNCSKTVTECYSTSFSTATRILGSSIRQDIYNIYGFVRLADEIVDTFHNYPKEALFNDFEKQMYAAIKHKISLNPILNSFQETVHKYQIEPELYEAFMSSMYQDLHQKEYHTTEEYQNYIYGSADVVGLMCLRVFTKNNTQMYDALKASAMKLGSAFQKVNFLRDLKADAIGLGRGYFPNTDFENFSEQSKQAIILEIEQDFKDAKIGITQLPIEAKLGVYTAYRYYQKLLQKLKAAPAKKLKEQRFRVPNYQKAGVFAQSYINYHLNLI